MKKQIVFEISLYFTLLLTFTAVLMCLITLPKVFNKNHCIAAMVLVNIKQNS